MSFQSSSHSQWNCNYYIVFIPKKRRKVIYGKIRERLKEIFHDLALQKGCKIVEGHLVKDHIHMCVAIPPKLSVSSVVGFLKGKSAIAIAREFRGKARNFEGENSWARGYCVSTVGFEISKVRAYIREQEVADEEGRF